MLRDKFLALFDAAGPERCGVVTPAGEIVEVPNVHPSPMEAFAFDAEVLERPELIATWHTHPRTGPNLSTADYRTFRAYPQLGHFIISASGIWLFMVKNDILVRHGNPLIWLSERTASGTDPR
jgi:proteasome lid subunit RPN8/RPN11